MQYTNTSVHRLNLYLYLAAVLGLMVGVLTVLPYFVRPALAHRQTTLQVAAQARPTSTAETLQPTPGVTPTIGPSPSKPGLPSPSPSPGTELPMGCQRYTIQAGDTLFSLARRFGTTETAIALINDLHSDILRINQVLIVCGPELATQPAIPAPRPVLTPPASEAAPARLEEAIGVVMSLTYPIHIHNRKPQWITLTIGLPQEISASGAGLLPDKVETTVLEPVILPVPQPPRISHNQTTTLVEHWLSAQLTGPSVMSRSRPVTDQPPRPSSEQALSMMLTGTEPITWQWLFVPPAAGDYPFGLDVFSSGEFEILGADGNMAGRIWSDNTAVWSYDFTVSVDEIFGIPRQWWLVASGLGALFNLILGLIQTTEVVSRCSLMLQIPTWVLGSARPVTERYPFP